MGGIEGAIGALRSVGATMDQLAAAWGQCLDTMGTISHGGGEEADVRAGKGTKIAHEQMVQHKSVTDN